MTAISAYIPCFNNAATIAPAIESVLALDVPVAELLIIDDGSTDNSLEIITGYDLPVIKHQSNLGRGAVRAEAMRECRHDMVLSLDGNKTICRSFTRDALSWFQDRRVAAVYGRIVQPPPRGVVERWRGRHLLKNHLPPALRRGASLITAGALVSKSKVLEVGNYDNKLRHSEDRQLGQRLLMAGFEVICDPALWVTAIAGNDLWQVLERYWRWNAGVDENVDWGNYGRQIAYSLKVMSKEDLSHGDILSVPISLLAPHYQFWRSALRKWN